MELETKILKKMGEWSVEKNDVGEKRLSWLDWE